MGKGLQKKEKPPEGCPLWVVTFGDAMSLLVTFFVMLVSFADFEEHALQDMMGALKGGLRAVPMPMATTIGRKEASEVELSNEKSIAAQASVAADEASEDGLSKKPANHIIRTSSPDYYLHLLQGGVSLVIRRDAVFSPGTDEITDVEHEAWRVAGDLVSFVRSEVRIAVTLPRNVPVRLDEYTTAWGLGIQQVMAVQEFLGRYGLQGDLTSTAVRVVNMMPRGESPDGYIELRFIGNTEELMERMPRRILRGSWNETEARTQSRGMYGQGG